MKRPAYHLLFALFLFSQCSDEEGCSVDTGLMTFQSISVNGVNRTYDLYVPSTYTCESSEPLLIDLHGALLSKENQRDVSKFNLVAEKEGFIVVFPQALNHFIPAPVNKSGASWYNDDVSPQESLDLFSALIEEMGSKYNIDANRVYVTGFSLGGIMAYSTACDMSEKIAAIGVVAGRMDELAPTCEPTRVVPVIHIHGTDDQNVPFSGTGDLGSIQGSIDFWVDLNTCDLTPSESDLPNSNTDDASTVSEYKYQNCEEGSTIEFYVISGGGHTWPGSSAQYFKNNPGLGAVNKDIQASEVIWEFLSQYHL